jgi:hypothetical protein
MAAQLHWQQQASELGSCTALGRHALLSNQHAQPVLLPCHLICRQRCCAHCPGSTAQVALHRQHCTGSTAQAALHRQHCSMHTCFRRSQLPDASAACGPQERRESVLVAAHTSAGKTVVAE